jgi:hypothetical protein
MCSGRTIDSKSINIKSLQNRLLKVYVPTTSAALPWVSFFFSFLFLLLQPLTVLVKQTRQAVRAIKQSIFLDVYVDPMFAGSNPGSLTSEETKHFPSSGVNSSWIRTLELTILSPLFNHCATVTGLH